MLKVSTDCSGIGSPEQALKELGVNHEIVFACERDKYARQTYLANFKPNQMFEDMTTRDNSQENIYADLYLAGIPCQSFSLAGKRLGELDPRGLLFYNFYDYVKQQQPKYFIIENVKGLLSDNKGKTFNNWLELLSSSVNLSYNMFPHPDSLMYNVHWTVLNSKDFGVPQNRERVFIVGIRNDLPNDFRFPIGFPLSIRLKDILEPIVDEKYYLSDTAIERCINNRDYSQAKINPDVTGTINTKNNSPQLSTDSGTTFITDDFVSDNIIVVNDNGNLRQTETVNCIDANYHKGMDNHAQRTMVMEPFCVAMRGRNPNNPNDINTGPNNTEQRLEPNSQGITNTITSVQKDNLIVEPKVQLYRITCECGGPEYIGVLSDKCPSCHQIRGGHTNEVTKEEALEFLSKMFSQENFDRIKNKVVNEPKIIGYTRDAKGNVTNRHLKDEAGTIHTSSGSGGNTDQFVYEVKEATKKGYDIATEGDSINLSNPNSETRRGHVGKQIANTLDTACNQAVVTNRIRRLTPLECMRLQGFPDDYVKPCSDTQTYKQAGNSITVNVIKDILKNLLKC